MSHAIKRKELKLFIENWGGFDDEPDYQGNPKFVIETYTGYCVAEGHSVEELKQSMNEFLENKAGYDDCIWGDGWDDYEEYEEYDDWDDNDEDLE